MSQAINSPSIANEKMASTKRKKNGLSRKQNKKKQKLQNNFDDASAESGLTVNTDDQRDMQEEPKNEMGSDSADSDYDEDLPSNFDEVSIHFDHELKIENSEKLKYETEKLEWPEIGKFAFGKPVQNLSCKEPSVKKSEINDFNLKKNLLDTILSSKLKKMSKTQIGFLNLISDYFDMIYMKRTHENGENLRFVYVLHILNHILKSRAKVFHHNSKLSKNPDEEYRDQGFTRPLAVILVPFRHDCYRIVFHLMSLLPECVVMNKKRFETEYGHSPSSEHIRKKPPDYYDIFEGNTNEKFTIGLKIKNKSVTLYSEFYSSDLIIASPLGLRPVIGAEGDKQRDYDFLSSVEILVIDRADVLMLQNIVNLLHVLKHFNLLPKESHGCNFFRVRMPILDGLAKFYRQNILLSSVENVLLEELVYRPHCFNYSGFLLSASCIRSPTIDDVLVHMKMCFRWFDTENLKTEIDDRFNFFVNKVLPDYKDKSMSQTLIYIPSYFDFVKLRNYFRKSELSAVMVCEYSEQGKVAQARNVFFKGYRHFMLYTERAHFYSRYRIKGIQHILFYQPPTYPAFFREMCNLLMYSNPRRQYEEKSCCVLASQNDLLILKHIVGLNEAKQMFSSEKKIFVKYIENNNL